MAGERLRQLRANLKHFLVSVVNTNVFNLPEIIISFSFFFKFANLKTGQIRKHDSYKHVFNLQHTSMEVIRNELSSASKKTHIGIHSKLCRT